MALGLGHFLDIIDFDRRVAHALDTVELYGGDAAGEREGGGRLPDVMQLLVAALDVGLTKELGRGWAERVAPDRKVKRAEEALRDPAFADLRQLIEKARRVFERPR